MEFGKNAGMITVFINTVQDVIDENKDLIDHSFPDLKSFAKSLTIK